MLHNLLPNADQNSGFDAFPNRARNYGWAEEHNAGVWVFPKTDGEGTPKDHFMTGSFVFPSGTPAAALARLYIEWSANVAGGSCRWQFAYKVVRGENLASLDVDLEAGFTEAFGNLAQAMTVARNRRYRQQDLNVANIQKGDRLFWKLKRNSVHAGDTLSGPALLFGLFLDDGI